MTHRTHAPTRRMSRSLPVLCLLGVLIGPGVIGMNGASAFAERADQSPAQLRRSSSDIVLGIVQQADSTVRTKGDWRYTDHVFTLRVDRVDQGDLALLDTVIEARAAQRGWIGRGLPPTYGSGHRGLPAVGDRVVAHLERKPAEVDDDATIFAVVEPNGFLAAPEPTSTEIEFEGHGGLKLAGTLLVPAGASADRLVGAAVLLPGSGPTDRDGNQLPQVRTELLRTLADSLADHGIATLRFDKRATMRYAGSWPAAPDEMADFFALENMVGDAAAAWRTLAADERVDAARILVIGHSEGGLIALALGAESARGAETVDPPLRGMGLLATAGRTLDVVIREQVVRSLDESGVPPALRQQIMESLDAVIASVHERGEYPETVHPALVSLFNPSTRRIMVDYFKNDPAHLAKSAPGAVILVIGDADIQVSSQRDTPRLSDALNARESGSTRQVVLREVGHNLKPVAHSDRFNFTGPVSPTALSILIDWAQSVLTP